MVVFKVVSRFFCWLLGGTAINEQVGQVFGPKVRVSLEHLQRLVAGDRGNLHRVQAALE